MNEHQLKSFVEAANCKSFSEAAKKNYISVSAFIQQIDLLERSIGFELFVRTKHGISLTEKGERFYKGACKILEIYNNTISECRDEIKKIRIAVAPEQCPDFMLSKCREFMKTNSDTEIVYINCMYNQQIEALKNNNIDITVIAKPKKKYLDELVYVPLFEDVYAFAVNPEYTFEKKSIINSKDLEGKTILCGKYPYMEYSFQEGLASTGANIISADNENDINLRSKILMEDCMLAFHSKWQGAYSSYSKIVLSNISAGNVGMLFRKKSADALRSFVNFMKNSQY